MGAVAVFRAVTAVEGAGSNGAYIHDRRGGEREELAESPGHRLSRHELDQLYSLTMQAGIAAGTVILSGPAREGIVPADAYRRLAADLEETGCTVIADLAGDRLTAAVNGGVALVKVSHDELVDSGRADSTGPDDLIRAMRGLVGEGAATVIVTRADLPSLLLLENEVHEVHAPSLETVDTSGAGDSLTAGTAAALASGESLLEAVTQGSAAGALNVTRHGLGTGDADTIRQLMGLVRIVPYRGGHQPERARGTAADEPAKGLRTE
ncbi:1-phosphofructokinase [Arthrobacter subterraneus]|uniref:1-phosphofructokinase n=1 Tax=Arthrobacter subterraneus TaxID=335973 RepID=A0A1G8N8A2_9MICC|nr:PfkB family carbohydrate kinase [Arthrobacter subterraneus]SDI76306.1 1-phosphofructokinase [Arthrobacter subterraneus]